MTSGRLLPRAAAVLLPLLGCAASAVAGGLADPTRPPAYLSPAPAAAPTASPGVVRGPARTAAAPASAAASAAAAVAPAQLQSVQVPRQGSASALVDGRIVRVGDVLPQGTVTAIDAEGMSLRTASGPQRLWLLDAVGRPGSASPAATQLAAPAAPASPQPPVGSAGALAASRAPQPLAALPKAPIASLTGKQP